MRLFVDIENKKLVQSLTSDRIAVSPSFMQGDNEPLEIHLLAHGTSALYEDKILNPAHDFLRVGIARFKGEPKLLTIGGFYTPLENGGCILTLPLNTVEIESALGNNPSLDAFLEIEYSTSEGRITTVLQTSCKVKNDLIEDAPNVEIPDQFLTTLQTEAMFLKKSDNLGSIEDKTLARENLNVFSKDEVYSKEDVDDKNVAFLQKSDNLASLENKDNARNNINAAHSGIYKDINVLGSFYGVYSRIVLIIPVRITAKAWADPLMIRLTLSQFSRRISQDRQARISWEIPTNTRRTLKSGQTEKFFTMATGMTTI